MLFQEGNIKIFVDTKNNLTSRMPAFYNPAMRENRDISLLVIKTLLKKSKNMNILFPMAATGVRGIRLFNILSKEEREKINIWMNDYKREAYNIMKKNLRLNKIPFKEGELFEEGIIITNMDANLLMQQQSFDYIDIDPFGSPNPFLDVAIKSVRHKGILAVTSTDTAPLAGTYPKACQRKYWAIPIRNFLKHESAIRILIRKVQLIGMQYGIALIPLLSYYHRHYYRVFFRVFRSKSRVKDIMGLHKHVLICSGEKSSEEDEKDIYQFKLPFSTEEYLFGPLWLGFLKDNSFIENLKKIVDEINLYYAYKSEISKKTLKILDSLLNELDLPFFYDLAFLSKKGFFSRIPSMKEIFDIARKNNIILSRTVYSPTGIKVSFEDISKLKDFI